MQARCIEIILVNDDWHLGNLRDYLVLQFSLETNFKFCKNDFIVRARREKLMFCKNYGAPKIIGVNECVNNADMKNFIDLVEDKFLNKCALL